MLATALFSLLPLLALTSATPIAKRHTGVRIKSGVNGQCLNPVAGAGDGTIVGTTNCDNAALWDIEEGSGSVILHGTNFALDATDGRTNNQLVKLWTSYPTLFQQTWYLTPDRRIAITGGDQCLDQGPSGPQTYKCTYMNDNQVWNVVEGGSNNGGGDVYPPWGETYSDPENGGRRLHPNGRSDLCVSVSGANGSPGGEVNIAACYPNDSVYAQYQLWKLPTGTGHLQLQDIPDLCLESADLNKNGAKLSVQKCDDAQERQAWDYVGERIKLGGAQKYCVDLELNSRGAAKPPYSDLQNLQTWECFPENTQQVFFLH
ncbi:hypothetical protein IAT38_002176 [Cryptococcus sp. DSM 104549]